jgi:hypothetical protein
MEKYIIRNIDNLTQEDRQNVVSLILMFNEEKKITELANGLAYNLDKAPSGLVEVIYCYIEKKLEQYRKNEHLLEP